MFGLAFQRLTISGSHLTKKYFTGTSCTKCLRTIQRSNICTSNRKLTVWEPDDVNLPPEIPRYECILIKMKGFDFTVLEKFSSIAVKFTQKKFDLKTDMYALPGQILEVRIFKPRSAKIESEYKLTKYERVLRVFDVPLTDICLLTEAIRLIAPPGVEFIVKENTEEDELFRKKPDHQLEGAVKDFEDLGGHYDPKNYIVGAK